MGVTHTRCPHARARGWAARCRPTCSTCSGRLGGAAAAGRTMVRSPAAPSPVRFSGLLFADSGADDGARVIGATDDDDVGFAGSGWWRRRDLRGRSINDGKFSSTDMAALTHTRCTLSRARKAGRRDADRPARPARAARVVPTAAGRTMVRSPAAPSPVRFSGLLFADSGADDGARAVGATDDDVGFAWVGAVATARPTGSIDQRWQILKH